MNFTRRAGHVIWSKKPAGDWAEGYPIGNGRLGGMILGDPLRDRVGLNHDRLWRRYWRYHRRYTAEDMPKLRQLCLEKKWDEAYDLMQPKIASQSKTIYVNPFVPLGDLGIYPYHFGEEEVVDYKRQLDMDKAIVEVSYSSGDVYFRREYFASWPAGVIVIHMAASRAGRTSGEVSLYRMLEKECMVIGKATLDELILEGRFEEGVRFASVVRVIHHGGRLTGGLLQYLPPEGEIPGANRPDYMLSSRDQPHWFRFRDQPHPAKPKGISICFDSSDEVLLLVAMTTDHEDSDDPVGWCRRKLDLVPTDYQKLKDEHIQDHQRLYQRVSINLGGLTTEVKPTDAMVQQACETGKPSPFLCEQLFNVGRYLAISSGRPAHKGQPYKAPINLQGIWNQDPRPAWDSDYHLDLNVEMCYWPLPMVNLIELAEPLIDWAEALLPQAQEAARDIYGVGGAFFTGTCDAQNLGNCDDLGMLSTGVSAWLAQTLWQVWEYNNDTVQLQCRIYPILRQLGQFYEEFLIEDDQGRLVPVPSGSPEICPTGRKWEGMLSAPSTFDLELIRQVFTNLLEASELLNVDKDKRSIWTNILEKLPQPTLDHNGCLLEWLEEDYEVTDPGHRHRSHFVSFCPGDRITAEDTPDYNEGIRKALARRLFHGLNTSCSITKAWDAQIFARLYESDKAMQQFEFAVTDHLMGNLLMCICDWRERERSLRWFGDRKIFQIEASIGMVAFMAEMFFQDRRGLLRLLPALPKAWPKGRITGLRSRGGFEIDLSWEGGKLVEATIRSLRGERCRVKSFTTPEELEVYHRGRRYKSVCEAGVTEFLTEKGECYVLRPRP